MSPGSTDVAFQRRLEVHRTAVDDVIAGIAANIPGNDIVSEAVRYALATGGKRLRPILCLAAIEAVSSRPLNGAHIRAATAIELVHTYSLVHDDLPCMDDDDLRRGRPTTHRVFGTRAAIAAGFALIPLACRVLSSASGEVSPSNTLRHRVVYELCEGAGASGMVAGQVLDLEAESADVSLEQLTRIHALKTGALFRAALRIGGVLGGADDAAIDALGSFGERLGLSFQITDDVLDVTMDAVTLGKTPGKDRDARKATFVSLLGVEGAIAAARAESATATRMLRTHALASDVLEGLARFAVDRRR